MNRVSQGSLVRVDPNGSKTVIVGDLAYPNGMEVDRDGFVYVPEQDGGRIRDRSHTGDNWVIAENLAPNGIIFGPNYQRLYFNSFGGGTVRLGRSPRPRASSRFIQYKPGGGGFDGLNVDECGNLCSGVRGRQGLAGERTAARSRKRPSSPARGFPICAGATTWAASPPTRCTCRIETKATSTVYSWD